LLLLLLLLLLPPPGLAGSYSPIVPQAPDLQVQQERCQLLPDGVCGLLCGLAQHHSLQHNFPGPTALGGIVDRRWRTVYGSSWLCCWWPEAVFFFFWGK